ncbi:MAG: hypothetical protein KGL39_41205 [Patescibacteria group bacterium]|nr:hypothetical protein [Patescibacteria group bacterium]
MIIGALIVIAAAIAFGLLVDTRRLSRKCESCGAQATKQLIGGAWLCTECHERFLGIIARLKDRGVPPKQILEHMNAILLEDRR